MSITAYKVEAVGHDRTGEDYGYVNIMYRYGNKQSCPRPDQCEKMEVMWADESVYGPPAPGSKVGDFMALRESLGLWYEILPQVSDPGRRLTSKNHSRCNKFCDVPKGNHHQPDYRCHGTDLSTDSW